MVMFFSIYLFITAPLLAMQDNDSVYIRMPSPLPSDEQICGNTMDVYFGSNGQYLRRIIAPDLRPKLIEAQATIFKSKENLVKALDTLAAQRRAHSSSSESSEEEQNYPDLIHDIVVSSLEEVFKRKEEEVNSFAAQLRKNFRDKKVMIATLGFASTLVASGTALALAFGEC